MQEIKGHSRKIYKEKMKSFYFYLLPNIEGVTDISSLYCVVELGMQISKDQHMLISTKKNLQKGSRFRNVMQWGSLSLQASDIVSTSFTDSSCITIYSLHWLDFA